MEILMHGVSTRSFEGVISSMAETVGVSKSAVSREFVEASEAKLTELMNRRFDDVELLILYLDGMVFGEHHVIAAVGVDAGGFKHVLGENGGAIYVEDVKPHGARFVIVLPAEKPAE